jgi:hypothetical protein
MEVITNVVNMTTCFVVVFMTFKKGLSFTTLYNYFALIVVFALTFSSLAGAGEYSLFLAFFNLVFTGVLNVFQRKERVAHIYKNINFSALFITITIILLLIFYHYYVVGFPIFSENIEQERFQTSGSGLGGVPSRLATYSPQLIIIITLTYLSFDRKDIYKTYFLVLSSAFLLLVQGHKSSILQLLFILLLVKPYVSDKVNIRLNKLFGLVMISVPILVFILYQKMIGLRAYSFLDYLIARFSDILLQPGFELFKMNTKFEEQLFAHSAIINDLMYPIFKLLGLKYETLNTLLSRSIYNVSAGDFTVPVTPGFFSYHFAFFGPAGLLVASFIFLFFLLRMERISFNTKRKLTLSLILYCQYWLYVGFTSGNLYYLVLNVSVVVFIFLVTYGTFTTILRSIARTS